MECGQWRELLSAGLDGESGDPESTSRAREHTAVCPDCARWLGHAAALRAWTRKENARDADRGGDPSPELVARVLDAWRDA